MLRSTTILVGLNWLKNIKRAYIHVHTCNCVMYLFPHCALKLDSVNFQYAVSLLDSYNCQFEDTGKENEPLPKCFSSCLYNPHNNCWLVCGIFKHLKGKWNFLPTTLWLCSHGLKSRSERRFRTWFGSFLIWKPDFSPCERKAVSN